MAILTESTLRDRYKKEKFTKLKLEKGEKLTPSAREFLMSRKIDIVENEVEEKQKNQEIKEKKEENKQINTLPEKRYYFYDTGALFFEKPEFMTHIQGNKLVYKDDKRIKFRGQLDTLESEILFTMTKIKESGKNEAADALKEIYLHVRKIMRAEVLGEKLEDFTMLGYDHQTIREMSHFPKKYFNKNHIMLDGTESIEVLLLNRIRTKVREVEISGLETFREGTIIQREDILRSLNRLSSAVYLLMLKLA